MKISLKFKFKMLPSVFACDSVTPKWNIMSLLASQSGPLKHVAVFFIISLNQSFSQV